MANMKPGDTQLSIMTGNMEAASLALKSLLYTHCHFACLNSLGGRGCLQHVRLPFGDVTAFPDLSFMTERMTITIKPKLK